MAHMQIPRERVCELTGKRLYDVIPTLRSIKVTLGLDGFVDEIISVVDKRRNHENYDAVRTIDHLGKKFAKAAGESSNYELVVRQLKAGGNGPIMAGAFAAMGLSVTYVGNLGYPSIHPVFEDLAHRATVHSIGEPAHTDALEFEDGKIMLGKLTPLNDANWDNLLMRVGKAS